MADSLQSNSWSRSMPHPEAEDLVLAYWKENQIFEKSVEQRPLDDPYVFIDGPPFVSGSPHYAHLLVSMAKDLVPRYWTMKGKRVRRVFGWDCHGLPIEAKVNEQLNLRHRQQVETFGVDRYVQACREYVEEQIGGWRWYIEKVGRWVDLDNAFRTMDPEFGESVVWAFKQMYEKGVVYRGKRVSLYSTETATPVSDFEVAMDPDNYREVEDLSVFVRFRLKDSLPRKASPSGEATGLHSQLTLLVWTTTPWTLPANFAVAVNPAFTYAVVQLADEVVVVAEDLLAAVIGEAEYTVLGTVSGKELVGQAYEPLFDFFVDQKTDNDFKVYGSDEVTNTEGTGILHVAPAFGELDFALGQEHGLSSERSIDDEGRMVVGPWAGKPLHQATVAVTESLEAAGRLFRSEPYRHRVPFYRGKKPLIYMAQDAYFIRLAEVNKRILALNKNVNWVPETFKEGRFQEVVENAPDWCISRNRYWGTVMPIWRSEQGDEIVVGSVEELVAHTDQITARTDAGRTRYFIGERELSWHRDMMDQIVLRKDGVEYRRVPEILDVWLDSGSVPFAEYHYPFENEQVFERGFPADFIIEYTGQIRAWFQVLFRVAVMLFDSAPFRNVVVHGVLAGTDGRKMSKSFNNYPDPKKVLETVGGDALRLYFMSSPIMVGENASFNEEELVNKVKGTLNIYWNSAKYFLTYAASYDAAASAGEKHVLDRWIRVRLAELITEVEAGISSYRIPRAVRAAEAFVTDLSTWYIRGSRERFVAGDQAALHTLREVLIVSAQAMAPLMPFLTERVYQALREAGARELLESVHLEMYPAAAELDRATAELLEMMAVVRELASAGHGLRRAASLPVRQPLAQCVVYGKQPLDDELVAVLRDELNVKAVEQAASVPLGAVTIRAGEWGITLDTSLTPELEAEGSFRNLVRTIKRMRQQAGLTVADRVAVELEDTPAHRAVLEQYGETFAHEVGATTVTLGAATRVVTD